MSTTETASPAALADSRSGKVRRRTLSIALAAAGGYYVGALAGQLLQALPNAPSSFWLPNALLLGLLLLTRQRNWWIYLLAVLPAHVLSHAPDGVPPAVMAFQYLSNTGQVLLSAWVMRHFVAPSGWFDRLRDTGLFILLAALAIPAVFAMLAAGAFVLVDYNPDFWAVLRTRLSSNVIAILTITPLVVLGFERVVRRRQRAYGTARLLEAGLLVVGLVVTSFLILSRFDALAGQALGLIYLPVPFFLWAAARFGLAGVCASVLALGSLLVWTAIRGIGVFSGPSAIVGELDVNLFLSITIVPLMLLAVAFEEKRRALSEAHGSTETFRRLAETTAVIPWEADPDLWRFTYVGPQACDMLGFPLARWYDTGFFYERFHPEDRHNAIRTIASAAERGQACELEYRMTTASGAVVWVQDIINVEHAAATPSRLHGFMLDITERKRAADELQSLHRRIAHASRVSTVGELTSSIAHDLQQPLTAILSNAEVAEQLLDADSPDLVELRDIVGDILNDDRRARDIVQRMRGLIQMKDVALEPVDLNAIVRETLVTIGTEASVRFVRLEFWPASGAATVMGDRVHLQQLVMNLLLNAFEALQGYPPGKRRVVVHIQFEPGDQVLLTVSDSGPGIPDSELPKLFEPFHTTKPDGLGIGLSIARRIADAHKGRIWAENNDGGGALFSFRLPLSR